MIQAGAGPGLLCLHHLHGLKHGVQAMQGHHQCTEKECVRLEGQVLHTLQGIRMTCLANNVPNPACWAEQLIRDFMLSCTALRGSVYLLHKAQDPTWTLLVGM